MGSRPRIHLGLGLRPPGLRLTFPEPTLVGWLTITKTEPERLAFDPPEVAGAATFNLVAIYAAPGDTVEVWGTEVGIEDVNLSDEHLSIVVAVEPATWGRIKARGGR